MSGPEGRAGLAIILASVLAITAAAAPQEAPASYFVRLWQLDEASRSGAPVITAYRSNYALVFSYNSTPNPAPFLGVDPGWTFEKAEFPFQLSLKVKVWPDVFRGPLDLWFGYTQRSFWQFYDLNESSPFRETNYEPEVLLNLRTGFSVLGLRTRFIQAGLNHQSNGRSRPLSRTWDRIVLNAGLERGNASLLVRTWFPIPESFAAAKNPRIAHYMGYGEIWGYLFLAGHRLGVMVRDNLNFRENRGALQIEWSFPLFGGIKGYVQYFLGYGESLIDCDHRTHRIGAGVILADWN